MIPFNTPGNDSFLLGPLLYDNGYDVLAVASTCFRSSFDLNHFANLKLTPGLSAINLDSQIAFNRALGILERNFPNPLLICANYE